MIFILSTLAFAGRIPAEEGVSVHALDNGLTVILQEDHRTDTIALHLRYGVGSRDERDGERGCAHLFEHLMFEGSKNVGQNKFDDWLTAAGGENNAYTSEDETAYHMTFPSGALDRALFLESDRMAYLLDGLTADNLKNQQSVVLQERAEGYTEPNGRDWDALSRLSWPEGHPYHVPVIGTVADIEGFTVDGVRSFWTRHYRPRNAVLVMVGHFETDAMLAAIHTWFDEVPDPDATTKPAPRVAPGSAEAEVPVFRKDGFLEDQVDARTLYLAWPTVPHGHPDEAPLDVLSYVLSAGQGTRLDDRVYYDSRLATSDNAYTGNGDIAGRFFVEVTTPSAPLAKVARIAESVVAGVVDSPPTPSEMDRAKRLIRTSFLDGTEYPADRAEAFAACFVVRGRPDCIGEEIARYEAVTPDDVVRVARQYIVPERRVSLSVIPEGYRVEIPGAKRVDLP